MKENIVSFLPEELERELQSQGEPRYRAGQVFRWLGRGVRSFDEMKDLPLALREKLKERYTIYAPKVLNKQISKLDGTIKYLYFFSGLMPTGLRLLRLNDRRAGPRSGTGGDAG